MTPSAPPPGSSAFTCTRIGGGVSDAMGRIAVVHDVMAHYAPMLDFVLPDYRNYHCPELDFLALLGVTALPHRTDPQAFARRVEMPMSALAQDLLARRFEPAPDTLYAIRPDLYHGRKVANAAIEALEARDGLAPRFLARLAYRPLGTPFGADPRVSRVTLHLRRKDICGGYLFGKTGLENPNPKVTLADKPLLHLPEAVSLLEAALPEGRRVEVVVASDGVAWLQRNYASHPAVLDRLDALERELQAPVVSERLDVAVVARLIGADPALTRATMDAMYHSDIVVTKSSSFASLIGGFAGFTLIDPNRDRPLSARLAQTHRKVQA